MQVFYFILLVRRALDGVWHLLRVWYRAWLAASSHAV